MVLYAFVTAVAAAYCLLAIWVAVGSGLWFRRMCALLGALALLVPIRAYEPLILFGMSSAMLIAGWGAVRLWEDRKQSSCGGRPNPLKFHLRDILLSCAVAAAASWMISVLADKGVTVHWRLAMGSAALLAGVSSLAVGVVRYRGWRWRLPLLIAGIIAAAAIHVVALDCWWDRAEMLGLLTASWRRSDIPLAILGFSIQVGQFALWSLFIAAMAIAVTGRWNRSIYRTIVRGTCAMLLTAAIVFTGWVYWRMLDVPRWSPSAANRPNALPRIIELATAAKRATPAQMDEIHAELFSLLDRPSFVVWPDDRPTTQELGASNELSLTRNLTRGLQARSLAVQAQGRYDEAADQCLAVLRLAPMLDAEGIGVHRWEAEAVRHMGHAWLAAFREKLSPDKARESARVILTVAAGREPIEATELRDRIWNDAITWRDLLKRTLLTELQGYPLPPLMLREAEQFSVQESCIARLLALDLLIRAYRQEHGQFPNSLAEVALPDFPDLATDPYSAEPFVYQPSEQGFILYSVGQNGIDEGGKLTNMPTYMGQSHKAFDLDVDTMTRP
ncbi:MAG TPA: hypothetical protein VFV87_15165 [Pirellulaceae bacterium]|nr:hypothetical protein [Pirellulaceae bacterium]